MASFMSSPSLSRRRSILAARPSDLFAGDALLPAFRVDKSSLDDYRAGHRGSYGAYGIDDSAVDEHVARLNDGIVQVMPRDLGDVFGALPRHAASRAGG